MVFRPIIFLSTSEKPKIKMYKTIILPVILYGFETWSFTLRGQHRFRVLRRIFGLKGEEVAGDWRRLHMRGFITCTLHQILLVRMRWVWHV
jgi:hypothetical protein